MSCDRISFAGFVRMQAKTGLAGARVEVIDRKKQVLGAGISGTDGSYRIEFRQRDDPALFKQLETQTVALNARGADGALLVSKRYRTVKAGSASLTDFAVPREKLGKFVPVGEPLQRLSGGLIDPAGMGTIDQAIRAIAPPGAAGHNRLLNAARCPLPDIAVFERLLDDAWEVLDGDPLAEREFRATLDLLGRQMPVSRGGPLPKRGVELLEAAGLRDRTQAGAGRAAGDTPPPSHRTMASAALTPHPDAPVKPHPCLTPPERFLPPYAAALQIARGLDDAAYLLGTLEHGLCGLERMNGLLGAATRALDGDGRRLEGMLAHFAGECGPDDGPLPPFPIPGPGPECPEPPRPPDDFPDPCVIERIDCVEQLIRNVGRLTTSSDPYVITAISPNDACPGDLVVITGSNFGNVPGQICFPFGFFAPGSTCVQAEFWSDTEIRVLVPAGAGSGELFLKIIEGHIVICGKIFQIGRKGEGVRTFLGGRATISSLRVDGKTNNACVDPATQAVVSWVASRGGAGNTVQIRVMVGATVLVDQSGLPDTGTLTFTSPNVNSERTLTVTATADHACGSDTSTLNVLVTVVPQLSILGMEVTQGIQVFPLQQIVNGAAAWVPLPTIAEKDTIVRVYVACNRGGFANDQVQNVTGTLRVDGTTLTPINGITPFNATGNPFITARNKQQINRATTNHTLNFRIPAALASGTRSLFADVFSPEICGTTPSAFSSLSWSWRVENALRVRFVRIHDNRPVPTGTGNRPTANQARFTVPACLRPPAEPADGHRARMAAALGHDPRLQYTRRTAGPSRRP